MVITLSTFLDRFDSLANGSEEEKAAHALPGQRGLTAETAHQANAASSQARLHRSSGAVVEPDPSEMSEERAEVLDTSPNQAVVRTPGRRFPGIVIQGDTLSILARSATHLARWIRRRPEVGDQVREPAQALVDAPLQRSA